jgi:retron-type reverse transcriptase
VPLLWPGESFGDAIQFGYVALESRIVDVLTQRGYHVVRHGCQPECWPLPDKVSEDDPLIRLVRLHDRGIIWYDARHVRPHDLIAHLAAAYPAKSILVIATHPADVSDMYDALKSKGCNVGRNFNGRVTNGQFQVFLSTYLGIGAASPGVEFRDMVIYTSPSEMFGFFGRFGIKRMVRARMYGCLPIGASPVAPLDDVLCSIFGDHEAVVPRIGHMAREVRVLFANPRVSLKHRRGEDDFALRRRAIWRHEHRNYRVAKLARHIADENYPALYEQFPQLKAPGDFPVTGGVRILVDGIEQGLAMKRHLHDWPLLVSHGVCRDGLAPGEAEQMIEIGPGSPECDLAIVTRDSLRHAGEFGVIIRADGGVGAPPLADSQLLGWYGEEAPLTIIDFSDRHHPMLRQWTRWRKAAYAAANWIVVGGPTVRARDAISHRGDPRPPVQPYRSAKVTQFENKPAKTAARHYHERRERRKKQLKHPRGLVTLAQIADRDHLADCFRRLQREGGPAPGVDGISPRDIAAIDIGDIAAKLSQALLEHRWRPRATKPVQIPKPGGAEMRTLHIGVVADRLVGKALHATLQPHLEKRFLDSSWGFRAKRSAWQMLAAIEFVMEKTGRWVLAIDDIRKAFDEVRVDDVLNAHRALRRGKSAHAAPLISEDVMRLLETLLRGHEQNRKVGIDQGCPYSPDALNVLLHAVHDLPYHNSNETLVRHRYADNLAYLCRTVTEGRKALAKTRGRLQNAGLNLKGKGGGVFNLNAGEIAQLLGYSLRKESGQLRLGLPGNWKECLRENLTTIWTSPNPQTSAQVLQHWIRAYGPAFESDGASIPQMLTLAIELGIRELPEQTTVNAWWKDAWNRWRKCRTKIRRRLGKPVKQLSH